ncbi:MAG: ROK family protein [Nostocoides sp.]
MADPLVVLGIDVGGTKSALALIDDTGTVLARQSVPTRSGGDDVERVAGAAADLLRTTRADGLPAPVAIGTGWPEYVDTHGRLTSTEVLTWARQPTEVLSTALCLDGEPLVVESDVRLGALGETRFGEGRGADSMLYVSLGTGLSAVMVIDGQPWRGARGEAIGFGEFPVPGIAGADWPTPTSVNLESFASGAGLAARAAQQTGLARTTRELTSAAGDGDVIAGRLLTESGMALGRGMAALVACLDPDIVVLGGGLGSSGSLLVQAARQAYEDRVSGRPAPPPLRIARTGADAGLFGAAAVALAAIG